MATKLSVALDWTPNTNHTGFYVAQAQGLYAAAGGRARSHCRILSTTHRSSIHFWHFIYPNRYHIRTCLYF
jgi:hypothetical protein